MKNYGILVNEPKTGPMADAPEFQIPKGLAREVDKTKAQVDIRIPNLDVKFKLIGKAELKDHCKVEHEFTEDSFDIKATITKDGIESKYRYKVGKLPGRILKDKCSEGIQYKDNYVIVTLYKAESESWAVEIERHALLPQTEF